MFRIQNVVHISLLIKTYIPLHDWAYSEWMYLPGVFINNSSRWTVTDKWCAHPWWDDCSCTFLDTQHARTSQPSHLWFLSAWILKIKKKSFSSTLLGSERGSCKLNWQAIGQQEYKCSFMLIFLPGGVGKELLRKEVKVPKKQLGLKAYIPF